MTSGTRSPRPPGPAPTPGFSSTPLSMSGTPPLPAAGSTDPIPARSTCSSTTRHATWPRSTWSGSTMTTTGVFDIEAYQHAVRLWTIVLEVSVAMAHFPSPEIARGSYDYRTLGLGYANLGSLLMRQGIAYDSDEGRAITGALTAILTGYSYATSAEMAGVVGPFPRYRREPGSNAPGDPEPSPRRLWRQRLRRGQSQGDGDRSRSVPARLPRRGPHLVGPGPGTGRAARLPQRPIQRDRTNRHHRPLDGL